MKRTDLRKVQSALDLMNTIIEGKGEYTPKTEKAVEAARVLVKAELDGPTSAEGGNTAVKSEDKGFYEKTASLKLNLIAKGGYSSDISCKVSPDQWARINGVVDEK